MFINGQKVVCIDGNFPLSVAKFYTVLPEEGKTYVVRGMAPGHALNGDPEIAVYLEGAHNPLSSKAPYRERGFKAERFRPLEELTAEEIQALSQEKEEVAA